MGYLIAYRHTGADPEYLAEMMPAVRDAFVNCGTEIYCTYFDDDEFKGNGMQAKEIMAHAFKKIDELGGLFVLLDGPEKSEGQLMEVGYCIAKGIPFIVAKRRSVNNTYLHQMTDHFFEYDDIDELKSGIKKVCEEK